MFYSTFLKKSLFLWVPLFCLQFVIVSPALAKQDPADIENIQTEQPPAVDDGDSGHIKEKIEKRQDRRDKIQTKKKEMEIFRNNLQTERRDQVKYGLTHRGVGDSKDTSNDLTAQEAKALIDSKTKTPREKHSPGDNKPDRPGRPNKPGSSGPEAMDPTDLARLSQPAPPPTEVTREVIRSSIRPEDEVAALRTQLQQIQENIVEIRTTLNSIREEQIRRDPSRQNPPPPRVSPPE